SQARRRRISGRYRHRDHPRQPFGHVSRETTAWLAAQPPGRFTFTFTPTHGSWLNLIEGFFSKLARSVLRQIRVVSKQELTERLMAFIGDVNREQVVYTWRYKFDNAA